MGKAHVALMALLVWSQPALADEPGDGQIGVRYLLAPEGMVLTRVHPKMGAAAAGLKPGDRIVAIDGKPIEGGVRKVGAKVRGEVDSVVKLQVHGPLGGPVREVPVTRSLRVPRRPSMRMHKVMAHFQASLKTGSSPKAAVAATKALIEAEFLGKSTYEAIGTALNRGAKRHPRVARAALVVLARAAGDDAGIHQRLGEAYFILQDFELASFHLGRSAQLWGADIQGEGFKGEGFKGEGFKGNVDARFRSQEMWIKALWSSGAKDKAIAIVPTLARTRHMPALLAQLELPDPVQRSPIHAHLPPIKPFETTLIDGTKWRLEEQRGKAVLLAYWASWCSPCKREMPELVAMWEKRKDQPFSLLAVSVDKPADGAKAARAAKQWGMSFPVAHDPELGQRMRVSGLPAVRLLGPLGSDRYAAKGYSPRGVEALSRRVDAVLKEIKAGDNQGKGQVIGQIWTRGSASMNGFLAIPGTRSVAPRPGGVVVGVRGADPVLLTHGKAGLTGKTERDVSAGITGVSGRVAWLDGPVASTPGGWWVRKTALEGGWFSTLTSPLQDMVVSGPHVWVAMEDGLVALGSKGEQVARFEANIRSMSADASGGVWAVDGTTLYRYTVDGMVHSGPAQGSWSVAADGRWGGPRVIQVVQGRFGPEGAGRTIAVRQDGTVVGLDAEGVPALSLSLARPPMIAVQDVDGDARDELLVVIGGKGLATVKLELP